MNTKNLMVSFCVLALALVFAGSVSAFGQTSMDGDLVRNYDVVVEGIDAYVDDTVAVIAGETIIVKVYFTANKSDTDVTVEAELEGEKVEFDSMTDVFDVEENKTYRKILKIKVPYELKDNISDDLTLEIEVDGRAYKTVLEDITLRVQRPSYNAVVKSITVPSSIEAGEVLPVDVVMKNRGYNDLDDVYLTVNIPSLGISQGPTWFGDLVNVEDCNDDCDKEDTVSGRLYLKLPYEVKADIYELEITVQNDDTETTETKTILIENEFSSNVIVKDSKKLASINEEVVYDLLLVNPTNNVKVYRIVTESTKDLSSTASQTIVAISAGSTQAIKVSASASEEEVHNFDVNLFEGDKLSNTVTLELEVEGKSFNSTTILTIVLAIIFLVLLVALVVLISRKPQKTEEFGESYY